eukprot:1194734-Prorocentrum_minimum.AAC.4
MDELGLHRSELKYLSKALVTSTSNLQVTVSYCQGYLLPKGQGSPPRRADSSQRSSYPPGLLRGERILGIWGEGSVQDGLRLQGVQRRGSIHQRRGSIRQRRGSIHQRRGSIHQRRGSIHHLRVVQLVFGVDHAAAEPDPQLVEILVQGPHLPSDRTREENQRLQTINRRNTVTTVTVKHREEGRILQWVRA